MARKCNRNIGKYSEIYGPISPPLLLDRKSSKKYWKIFLNLRPHFPASAIRLVVHHSGAPARLCTRSKTYKARLCTTSKTVQKQPEQIIVSHCSAVLQIGHGAVSAITTTSKLHQILLEYAVNSHSTHYFCIAIFSCIETSLSSLHSCTLGMH